MRVKLEIDNPHYQIIDIHEVKDKRIKRGIIEMTDVQYTYIKNGIIGYDKAMRLLDEIDKNK